MFNVSANRLQAFKSEWWLWWKALQPPERLTSGGELLKSPGLVLEMLDCPGKNGLLSVVATLFSWRRSIEPGGAEWKDWLTATQDVSWVMGELSASVSSSTSEGASLPAGSFHKAKKR